MKILITYHSDTGNTEKVAKSMKEGLDEEGQDVSLMPAKDIDPSSLKTYDLVLLGTGIYGGGIGKSIKSFASQTTEFPSKFAYFCTHSSPNSYPKAFRRISKTLEKYNSTVIGVFDCIGANTGISKEVRQKMLANMSNEERKEAEDYVERIKDRPNEEDLEKAKAFAKSLIK